MPRCVAPFCGKIGGYGVGMFKFPDDRGLNLQWRVNMGRGNSKGRKKFALSQGLWKNSRWSRLCSEHFEDSCFVVSRTRALEMGFNPGKLQLVADAIPTIFKKVDDAPAPVEKLKLRPVAEKRRRLAVEVSVSALQRECWMPTEVNKGWGAPVASVHPQVQEGNCGGQTDQGFTNLTMSTDSSQKFCRDATSSPATGGAGQIYSPSPLPHPHQCVHNMDPSTNQQLSQLIDQGKTDETNTSILPEKHGSQLPNGNMSYILNRQASANADHSYSIRSGCIKSNEPSPEYMARFDEVICDFMRDMGVPGAALSLSLHGKPIYKQGYGTGSGGVPVSASSHFRIASISKVLTAIGVMKLCEEQKLAPHCLVFEMQSSDAEGILNLSDINVHPEFAKLTVEHLLNHSGGWDRDLDDDHVFLYQKERDDIDPCDNMSLLRYVLPKPPRFPPGTRHAYSNFGYLLLGLVIEAVTGMDYEDYIHALLTELGIHNLFVGHAKKLHVDYREIDYYNNSEPEVATSIFPYERTTPPQYGSFPMRNTGAYGGWVTSPAHLVTILDSLVMRNKNHPHLLNKNSVKMMLRKPKFAQSEAWYGCGLDIEDRGLSFGHTGAMEGTAATAHHHKSGLTWSLLLNAWAKDMDLDGLVKYAVSTVPSLPLWHGLQYTDPVCELSVMSTDALQCVRIQLSHDELVTHIMGMVNKGFNVSHINALSLSDQVLFNVVWNKSTSGENRICVDVKLNKFNDTVNSFREHQFYISTLESYVLNGEVCHLFVIEKSTHCPAQKVYCVDNKEELEKIHECYLGNGYHIQLQAVLEYDGQMIISAVYVEGTSQINSKGAIQSQEVWTDIPIVDFVDMLGKFSEKRLSIDYLQFYSSTDDPKISCIWSKRKLQEVCFQRHDVSKYGFLYELRASMKTNLPVKFVSCYEHEGISYFAAIYGSKARSHDKSNCNEAVEDHGSTVGQSNEANSSGGVEDDAHKGRKSYKPNFNVAAEDHMTVPELPVPNKPTADRAKPAIPASVKRVYTRTNRSSKKQDKTVRKIILETYNDQNMKLLPKYRRYHQLFQTVKSELIMRRQRILNNRIVIEMDIAETDAGLSSHGSEITLADQVSTPGVESSGHTIKMEVEESESTNSDSHDAYSGHRSIKTEVNDTNMCVGTEMFMSKDSEVSNMSAGNVCMRTIKSEVMSDDDGSADSVSNINPLAKEDTADNTAMREHYEDGGIMTIPESMFIYENGKMECIKIEVNADELDISDPVSDSGRMDEADATTSDCQCGKEAAVPNLSGTSEFLMNNASDTPITDRVASVQQKQCIGNVKDRRDVVESSIKLDVGYRETKYSQTQEFIQQTHHLINIKNEVDVT